MEWIEDTSSQLVGLHLKNMLLWLTVFSQQSLAIPPGSGRAQILKHQKNRKKNGKKHNAVCMYMNVYVHTHTRMYTDLLTHSVCSVLLCGGRGACMFCCIPDPVLVDDGLAGTM